MEKVPPPTALLVAVDFSPASLRALATALSWKPQDSEVTVVHVIDTALAHRLETIGICAFARAIESMRARAKAELDRLGGKGEFETMVVEGAPFAEIVKIAEDLDCDAIVMGSRGAEGRLEELLFGSTAEKVLRGARRPVLCVP